MYPSRVEISEHHVLDLRAHTCPHQVRDIAQREELPLAALEGRSDERLEGVADDVAFALDQAVLLELAYNVGNGAVVCIIASLRSTATSTGYPSSWPHPTTQVIDDTIYARTHPQQSRATPPRDPATTSSDYGDSGDFHRHEGNDSAQRIPQRVFGTVELVSHLQVHPEPRGRTEVAGETHCSVRCNPALPMDDLIDTTGRNTDSNGELVLRNSEALDEVLHEDFTRVNRSHFSGSQRSQPLLDQHRPT